MKNVERACCLLLIFCFLSIPLFAKEYGEDFNQPVGDGYTVIDNLTYVNNIGAILSIDNPPDASGMVLSNRSETGSVVFKATGAQTVCVGFYATYGLFAQYSAVDDTYQFCEPAAGGRLLPMLYDAGAQSLCVQDGEKYYYLTYDSQTDALGFNRLDPAVVGAPARLSYAFVNIYSSADGRAYTRITHSIVQLQSGETLNTLSGALYCKIVADLPAGSKYIKVEVNQPSRMVTGISPLQWSPFPIRYSAILANIYFSGEQLVMGGGNDSSSPVSSRPTDSDSSTGSNHSSRESGRENADDDATPPSANTPGYPNGSDAVGRGSPIYGGNAVLGQPASENREITTDGSQQTSAEPSNNDGQSVGVVNADSKRASTLQTAGGLSDFSKVVMAGAGIATVLGITYIIIKFARSPGNTAGPVPKDLSAADEEESS